MPPKKSSGGRKPAKKSTASRSKTSSSAATTNKLLRQLINGIGGGSVVAPRVRQAQYNPYTSFGQSGPTNENPAFEYGQYEGNTVGRINCGPGSIPNYETGACQKTALFNTPCGKGQLWDPVAQECKYPDQIGARLGWRWEGNKPINVGIPFNRTAFGEFTRLPTEYQVGKGDGKPPTVVDGKLVPQYPGWTRPGYAPGPRAKRYYLGPDQTQAIATQTE